MKLHCFATAHRGRLVVSLPSPQDMPEGERADYDAILESLSLDRKEGLNNDFVILLDEERGCVYFSDWHWKDAKVKEAAVKAATPE